MAVFALSKRMPSSDMKCSFPSPTSKERSEGQWPKASHPIRVTPSGMVIVSREEQREKAKASISFILSGKTKSGNNGIKMLCIIIESRAKLCHGNTTTIRLQVINNLCLLFCKFHNFFSPMFYICFYFCHFILEWRPLKVIFLSLSIIIISKFLIIFKFSNTFFKFFLSSPLVQAA